MLNTSKKLSLTTTLIILTNILYLQTSSCQEPYFKATFENGIDTEIGGYRIETKNGAEVKRIQNPFPDNMNSSSFVIKSVIYKNDQTK